MVPDSPTLTVPLTLSIRKAFLEYLRPNYSTSEDFFQGEAGDQGEQ